MNINISLNLTQIAKRIFDGNPQAAGDLVKSKDLEQVEGIVQKYGLDNQDTWAQMVECSSLGNFSESEGDVVLSVSLTDNFKIQKEPAVSVSAPLPWRRMRRFPQWWIENRSSTNDGYDL
jgi:hypothetical protein